MTLRLVWKQPISRLLSVTKRIAQIKWPIWFVAGPCSRQPALSDEGFANSSNKFYLVRELTKFHLMIKKFLGWWMDRMNLRHPIFFQTLPPFLLSHPRVARSRPLSPSEFWWLCKSWRMDLNRNWSGAINIRMHKTMGVRWRGQKNRSDLLDCAVLYQILEIL